jgi:hypothetical protein
MMSINRANASTGDKREKRPTGERVLAMPGLSRRTRNGNPVAFDCSFLKTAINK